MELWSPTLFTNFLSSPLAHFPQGWEECSNPGSDAATDVVSQLVDAIKLRECTSLMLRNLPNKLSAVGVADMLTELGYAAKYDYLFMPLDASTHTDANRRNLGYCFINFLCIDDAISFGKEAYGRGFGGISTKTCKVSIALEQGVVANLKRICKKNVRANPHVRIDGVMQVIQPSKALEQLTGIAPVAESS